jgi:predicted TIM-barrel fold metal-dependent hydrolase
VGASRLDLAEHVDGLRLVDNHVHGYWLASGDRTRFENGLNEANTEPLASFDSAFDTQLGFAVRAHCAVLLGLPKHADPSQYWNRRSEFAESELARLFLSGAGVSDWLVDTGIPGDLAGPAQLAEVAGGNAYEVVRLEQVAQQAIAFPDYVAAFDEILSRRAAQAVATKSVLAYRGGFDGDLSEPSEREVKVAAARWRDSGESRLTDRVLLRFGLHQALRLGLPLQLHVGFGDRDCDLHRTNPLLLLDFLRSAGSTPIVLLHCYPYEREAGYLAQAFNNVYLDTGLPLQHLGARAEAFLARTLEMAPFRKIMYSSDGVGPPELHFLGAALWRRGMSAVLGSFVDRGEWSLADAARVSSLIGRENAIRVYQL